MPSLQLHIRGSSAAAWLRPRLFKLLRLLRVPSAQWSVAIVRDRDMKALHARTMNDPSTTDVLTFDLRDPPLPGPRGSSRSRIDREGCAVELDTVVCVDEARRRAQELSHPVRHELLLYCLHSLLHVQGYNDLTALEAQAMHVREDQLLVALGIGPVYGGKARMPQPTKKSEGQAAKNRTAEGTRVKRSRPR